MIPDEQRTPAPTGPGCLMLAAILVGTFIGLRSHQATIGVLGGIAVAATIAVLMWLRDRWR